MAKSKKEKDDEAKVKLAAEKKAAKEKADKEVEDKSKKEGFLGEITVKINSALSMSDLEALNQRVYDIWGDSVPNEIQVLASKKGEELSEKENASAKSAEKKNETPSGWVKCSEKEAKAAEKAGTLAGYDPERGLALINKS